MHTVRMMSRHLSMNLDFDDYNGNRPLWLELEERMGPEGSMTVRLLRMIHRKTSHTELPIYSARCKYDLYLPVINQGDIFYGVQCTGTCIGTVNKNVLLLYINT